MSEEYRDVVGYKGLYKVSNLGNVKSYHKNKNGKNLKISLNNCGYAQVSLSKNKRAKVRLVHHLVAESFLSHKSEGFEFVIDHINNIKHDNTLKNLQVVTVRFNTTKKSRGKSSYVGVSWESQTNKWRASLRFKGRLLRIGRFKTEIEAHNAYKEKLKSLLGD